MGSTEKPSRSLDGLRSPYLDCHSAGPLRRAIFCPALGGAARPLGCEGAYSHNLVQFPFMGMAAWPGLWWPWQARTSRALRVASALSPTPGILPRGSNLR